MAPAFDTNGVWLITGCSRGLGKSLAEHIYNAGHNVVATARNIDTLTYLPDSPKVLKLHLDITSQDDIKAATSAVVKRFGRLDVVINNAGYASLGEAEGFPDDEARRQMDTHFWGPMYLTKESIRIFREVNPEGQGGTVVQLSSIGGYMTFPGNSFYHASKFALEGFTKSVNQELSPKWNIKLMIAAPGGMNTEFGARTKLVSRHPAYANDPNAALNPIIEYTKNPSTAGFAEPAACAAVLFEIVLGQRDRPLPSRLNLGADALMVIKSEIDRYEKEMKEWEEETMKVTPKASGDQSAMVDMMGKIN